MVISSVYEMSYSPNKLAHWEKFLLKKVVSWSPTHPLELGPILGIRNEEVPTVLFKQHKEVYVLKKVVHYNDIKKPD